MTQRKNLIIVLAILLIPPVIVLSILVPGVLRRSNADYFARENIATIGTALNKFKETYGGLPGGDNAAIFRALEGANTNGEVFIEAERTNAAGEILDSWGTPYRIQLTNNDYLVRSAGTNRIFGDADDIVYDSIRHQFVAQP